MESKSVFGVEVQALLLGAAAGGRGSPACIFIFNRKGKKYTAGRHTSSNEKNRSVEGKGVPLLKAFTPASLDNHLTAC